MGWAWLLVATTPQVVLLPTRSVDVPFDVARAADEAATRALGPNLLPTDVARRRLGGRAPGQLAESCDFDVLCLAELSALSGADLLLSAKLQVDRKLDTHYALELVAIDAAASDVKTVLRWSLVQENLRSAMAAAVRRVSLPPDLVLMLESPDRQMEVTVYGEPVDWPQGEPFGFWSGRWDLRFTAPGKLPEARTLELQPSTRVRVLRIELSPDLLYAGSTEPKVEVFDRPSRRVGSGATVGTLRLDEEPNEDRSPAAKILPWVSLGLSLGAAVAGGVLMVDAQLGYNDLAAEARAGPSTTAAGMAAFRRDEAASRMELGNALFWPGLGGTVVSAIWVLVSR